MALQCTAQTVLFSVVLNMHVVLTVLCDALHRCAFSRRLSLGMRGCSMTVQGLTEEQSRYGGAREARWCHAWSE